MTPTPSNINPSQTVERIREIIVGRQLERIERRVTRLETQPSAMPVAGPSLAEVDDRLCNQEARLEALQDSLRRLSDSTRESTARIDEQHRLEVKRLSAQIQEVAAARSAEPSAEATSQIETRIGTWLNQWQGALHQHLCVRDEDLTRKIHEDVASLWENTESQLTRIESRMIDRDAVEERFQRIAKAATALAQSASAPLPESDYAAP